MALTFGNPTTSVVTLGSRPQLRNLRRATLMAWVYPTSLAPGTVIMSALTTGWGGWLASLEQGGFAAFEVGTATGDVSVFTADGTVVAGQWLFVAYTWDADKDASAQAIHLGGPSRPAVMPAFKRRDAQIGSALVAQDTAVARIGNYGIANFPFRGHISWVGLWPRQLTSAEIRAQQFSPQVTPGCVGFWWLGGTQGTGVQRDLSGYGAHGVVSGAPATAWDVPLPRQRQARLWFYGSPVALPSRSLYVQVNKPTAGQSTAVGTPQRQAGKRAAGTLSLSGLLQSLKTAQQFFQDLAGSIAASGTVSSVMARLLALAGSVTARGLLSQLTVKTATGSVTGTGALVRRAVKTVFGSVIGVGIVGSVRTKLLSLAGSLAASGMRARQVITRASGTLAPLSWSVRTRVSRVLAGALTILGQGRPQPQKRAGGSVTATGLIALRNLFKTAGGSLTLSGLLTAVREGLTQLFLTGSLTLTGTQLLRSISALRSGTLAAFGNRIAHLPGRLLSGSVTASGGMVRRLSTTRLGSVTLTGLSQLRLSLNRLLTGIISLSGLTQDRLSLNRLVAGILRGTGRLEKRPNLSPSGSLTVSGVLSSLRAVIVLVTGSLTPSGLRDRFLSKSLTGSSQLQGVPWKRMPRVLSGSLTGSGFLQRSWILTQLLSGLLAAAGSSRRTAGKLGTGSLTLSSTSPGLAIRKALSGLLIPVSNLVVVLLQQYKVYVIVDDDPVSTVELIPVFQVNQLELETAALTRITVSDSLT